MYLQNQDADGGIRGGPNIEWYATEHNLDAYAFFNMLYPLTAKPQYLQAWDKALNWLVNHTYDKLGIPVKRGKGDSTIATDTYAWSIAAIGPRKLEEIGMDPDKILGILFGESIEPHRLNLIPWPLVFSMGLLPTSASWDEWQSPFLVF